MPSFLSLLSLLGLLSTRGVFASPYYSIDHGLNVTMVQRADVSKCAALSIDDAKKMPGWAKLERYAKDKWGDGDWNIVTNPEDFLGRPANACVDDSTSNITPKGSPQCTSRVQNLSGTSDGTDGEQVVSVSTGQSTEGSWTVSQSSSFNIGTSFTVDVGFEGLFDASTSITTSTTFENSSGRSFSTTTDSTGTQQVTTKTKDGQNCGTMLEVITCNQEGEGKVRIVASGYVWFNYEDRRAPKNDPDGDEHYKYSAHIDDILTLDERSSWMSFNGAVKGISNGHYNQFCNDDVVD
ncbi:hypothetical protein AGABI2DRAFT_180773 [Agaricus bisporus var. bisporus H97]|uniref:hypothetical protein n=1 Tax=Agaricus bisporus var. bisporus (strain H97 / ATCC MYA-4626 / FGSC 10389) TaxID=936046 RepID=UPI00029F5DAA|nr:hypothetical protein AGABI2DRAFT_180773 [Agaricus bisporus var. bisporus H97]EKV43717.1 hypothetical protein AGABI2DRAFT_180773 [Agaricus bisporus var. bisporus H97]